ncbi:efflux RND transporter periplasmic adaptor subunit [Campylobacter canadensis]|uniref:efflux RND transporter periplasmic adaptor subunit n=1 Tax=Campylobacter canadensis TaxID=449520 RepID=UPI001556090B|nr:efflux RND transporter periplasmic adaptor subunit [Campylobacter canadensis]MBZ7994558.1 efflux RND transporter periplasmic adaptor subunit [Campylobacter canadensis]MBZ7997085.1 efflux RND transporter periplasmic adaptor subunit [Campylobacter canadensis]MBZ7999889.1 efflux RND transporter periplasmic adaptor subunit [Campylobacter canadensis]MBZ8001783.1 efflux RND transporter periplasmic adaptor subunit [Campylobacter canadensis]MBZ8004450.1 efflux RND transporter periplasmic adaptor su
MRKILLILSSIYLFANEIYASFDVIADKSSKLALSAGGVVSKIYVDVASKVKKGDLLLELDSDIEEIALKQAKSEYELAKIGFEHANNTLNRYLQVKNVIDEQSLESIKAKQEEFQTRLNTAQINILRYETMIKKKKLYAPFSGVISAKLVEVAEGVGGVMQPLFVLDSYPKVKLLLSFDEKYKDLVKIGDSFSYQVNDKKMQGKISKIYPNIDVKTRKVYAEVDAQDLSIGLFGEGYIKVGE